MSQWPWPWMCTNMIRPTKKASSWMPAFCRSVTPGKLRIRCRKGLRGRAIMKAKHIFYWAMTLLIALETFAGGVMDLTHGRTNVFSGPTVVDVVTSLGYPVYVLVILGIWKIPGAITLVVPGFLRLKEWAYAGIVFELS